MRLTFDLNGVYLSAWYIRGRRPEGSRFVSGLKHRTDVCAAATLTICLADRADSLAAASFKH
jgi:hypothetical protein